MNEIDFSNTGPWLTDGPVNQSAEADKAWRKDIDARIASGEIHLVHGEARYVASGDLYIPRTV